jgi:hypothetical protein
MIAQRMIFVTCIRSLSNSPSQRYSTISTTVNSANAHKKENETTLNSCFFFFFFFTIFIFHIPDAIQEKTIFSIGPKIKSRVFPLSDRPRKIATTLKILLPHLRNFLLICLYSYHTRTRQMCLINLLLNIDKQI